MQTYEESAIKQENAEGSRTPSTQTFTCKGEITGIDVYILTPKQFYICGGTQSNFTGVPLLGLTAMMPGPTVTPPSSPSYITITLYIKDFNNNVLFQSEFSVTASFKPMSIWKSITVPNLELNGKYKLQLTGVSWYYGSGYPNGSADFNANKDFCFRIHYKKEKTVYPKEVKYKTDLMDSYETISTNLQNGTKRITIPKENIDGATELSLSSQNGNVLTKISWNLKVFHKVPETPAKLSLPFVTIEGNNTTFQIRYTDINNDPPLSAKIYINDVEYDLVNNDDDSYQWNGSLYSITLPYQECNYYFIFDNGKETIRMPEDSFYIGELEKKLSEWKENIEEESILIDQELEKIDLYYIQENNDPQILKSLMNVKLDQIKKTAKNYRFVKDIHYLASQREEIMSFENLTDAEIDSAFTEIQNGFPEEVKEIFRNYGMTEENIEKLRTDILNNKEVIKEKRILSNFIDLKENYIKIALLNIESFSNASYRYFEKYNYVYNPLPEKKQIVMNAWNVIDDLNPNMELIKTKSLEIIQNGEMLVENGNFQYLDDINAALVYYFIAETGDPELMQELASNFEIYNRTCDCEKTLQDHFNYAKTVKFNTVNGRDTIDNIKIIIRPPGVDTPLMPIKKQPSPEPTPVEPALCKTCRATMFTATTEGIQEEQAFADVPIDCDGVPDSDNDGWCDDIDPCPYTPGVNCPESDIDHDGIPDDEDDCPNDPGTSYYNGCPAPGEEDTDGDGVPDTYDHYPNQAGPASNNGCPLPEDCLCKDDPEVKKLLSDLGVQEDLIQQGEDLVEEKRNELSETLSKINEAIKEEKENWDWTNWSIDVGKATLSIIGILASEGTLGIVIGGSSGSLSLYQYREKHPLVKKMTLTNLNKLYALTDLISHHESILEWRVDRVIEVTNELRDKCACALN
ncbi:MAG: hypothetical protein J7L10_02550 [Methanomicrobia archaeon]|nr:hypothetical protein [Methanomicrobia archaeon]